MLSLKPQRFSDTAWYYEEGRSVCLVVEHRNEQGDLLKTDQFRIPWGMLERSVMRKQQARAIAKAKATMRKKNSRSERADASEL